MTTSAVILTHSALAFMQLAFASLHVEGKLLMGPDHGVSPLALALLRIGGAAVVFISLYLLTQPVRALAWRDTFFLVMLAFLGVVNNQVLYLTGLHNTSPISATLLVILIPILTAIIAALLGKDRLSQKKVAGMAIAFFGVAILVNFTLPQKGDTLVFFNALSFSLYMVLSKEIFERLGTLTVMAWVFGTALLMVLPFSAANLVANAPSWSPQTIWLIVYIVLVPTVLFYAVNGWALRRATPTNVTIWMFLQPLAVLLLVWIQFAEPPTFHTLYAMIFIMSGVALVILATKPLTGHEQGP